MTCQILYVPWYASHEFIIKFVQSQHGGSLSFDMALSYSCQNFVHTLCTLLAAGHIIMDDPTQKLNPGDLKLHCISADQQTDFVNEDNLSLTSMHVLCQAGCG